MAPTVGVLALQGDVAAHAALLGRLGADVREVRVPADLDGLDGLVIPGGESTVMMLGIAREGLAEPLRALAAAGTPVLGTCAGLILLDRDHLGLMDIRARRNAFGRQIRSFEVDLAFEAAGPADAVPTAGASAAPGETSAPGQPGAAAPGAGAPPLRAVFIRAPWVEEHGPDVEILATVEGHPVAVREGNLLGVSFHPELSGDGRIHERFLALIHARAGGA